MYSRFQESIAVAIDLLNSGLICHADMVWLDPDKLPVLLMSFVNTFVPLSLSSLK